MAIQVGLDGVGAAIAQLPYVSDLLAAGRLATAFPATDRTYEGWYLIHRSVRAADPPLFVFRDWLRKEAKLQRQIYLNWQRSGKPILKSYRLIGSNPNP